MTQGLVFRDMTLEDVPAGLRLCRIARWNQRAEDWQALLANGFFRVALRGAAIVGSGGAVVYGGRLAWVAMILVDPAGRARLRRPRLHGPGRSRPDGTAPGPGGGSGEPGRGRTAPLDRGRPL